MALEDRISSLEDMYPLATLNNKLDDLRSDLEDLSTKLVQVSGEIKCVYLDSTPGVQTGYVVPEGKYVEILNSSEDILIHKDGDIFGGEDGRYHGGFNTGPVFINEGWALAANYDSGASFPDVFIKEYDKL